MRRQPSKELSLEREKARGHIQMAAPKTNRLLLLLLASASDASAVAANQRATTDVHVGRGHLCAPPSSEFNHRLETKKHNTTSLEIFAHTIVSIAPIQVSDLSLQAH